MADKNSLFVKSNEKPSLINVEGATTGAAKGLMVGSIVPGIGQVIGAGVGAVAGSFGKYHEQNQALATGKEVKKETIFNREMLVGASITTALVATASLSLPMMAAAAGATFIAGKVGEARMKSEYKAAEQQVGAEQVQASRALQAGNMLDVALTQQQQHAVQHAPGANNIVQFNRPGGQGTYKNSSTPEEYAAMQRAMQERSVQGRFTQKALAPAAAPAQEGELVRT